MGILFTQSIRAILRTLMLWVNNIPMYLRWATDSFPSLIGLRSFLITLGKFYSLLTYIFRHLMLIIIKDRCILNDRLYPMDRLVCQRLIIYLSIFDPAVL